MNVKKARLTDKTHRIDEANIHLSLKKSGYFLEQRMANLFTKHKFYVVRNTSFADPFTGKSREIDLEASLEAFLFESILGQLEYKLVCECKNKFQPIVFFKHQDPSYPVADGGFKWAGYPKTIVLSDNFEVDAIRLGNFGRRIFSHKHDSCSQWCSFKYNENLSSWMATGDEEDYLSISGLITATRQQINLLNSMKTYMHWTVFQPVLILQNDFYLAWEERARIKLKKTQHVTLKVQSSYLGGNGQLLGDVFNVSVISEKYFKTFANQVKNRFEHLKKTLVKNKAQYLKAMNWSENETPTL